MKISKILLMLALGWLISACESTATRPYAALETPRQLSQNPDTAPKGKQMTWGGEIVSVKNLRDRTIIQILAYPLDSDDEPDTGERPQGRFLADHEGFLEPRNYPVGSLVTVSGPLLGFTDGKIGETSYRFPALDAQTIRVWRRRGDRSGVSPNVNFGLGIGNSGARGGVGVGIGF